MTPNKVIYFWYWKKVTLVLARGGRGTKFKDVRWLLTGSHKIVCVCVCGVAHSSSSSVFFKLLRLSPRAANSTPQNARLSSGPLEPYYYQSSDDTYCSGRPPEAMARVLLLLLLVGTSLGFHILQRPRRVQLIKMQSPVQNMELEKFSRILKDDSVRLVSI